MPVPKTAASLGERGRARFSYGATGGLAALVRVAIRILASITASANNTKMTTNGRMKPPESAPRRCDLFVRVLLSTPCTMCGLAVGAVLRKRSASVGASVPLGIGWRLGTAVDEAGNPGSMIAGVPVWTAATTEGAVDGIVRPDDEPTRVGIADGIERSATGISGLPLGATVGIADGVGVGPLEL